MTALRYHYPESCRLTRAGICYLLGRPMMAYRLRPRGRYVHLEAQADVLIDSSLLLYFNKNDSFSSSLLVSPNLQNPSSRWSIFATYTPYSLCLAICVNQRHL